MRSKSHIWLFAVLFLPSLAVAQTQNVLNHMDIGVHASTMGIGADIAMPVGNFVRVRTGFTYMPQFEMKSNFRVEMNNSVGADRERRMKDLMRNFTGQSMQDNVDMLMTPTWTNFKFLVDVRPFRQNKHWSVTAGFYAGPSRIGKAVNDESAIPTLTAVNMYNSMYYKACRTDDLFVYEMSNGTQASASVPQAIIDRMVETGMMGMPLGNFPDGEKAMMVPNVNCMAKAVMEVSKFRPYVGIGYNTNLSRDGKWNFQLDAGVLFWGGKPHVYVDNVYKLKSVEQDATYYYYDMVWMRMDNYEYVDVSPQRIDLTRDVSNIRGKVGDMVKTVRRFTCYPVLSLTVSHTIF